VAECFDPFWTRRKKLALSSVRAPQATAPPAPPCTGGPSIAGLESEASEGGDFQAGAAAEPAGNEELAAQPQKKAKAGRKDNFKLLSELSRELTEAACNNSHVAEQVAGSLIALTQAVQGKGLEEGETLEGLVRTHVSAFATTHNGSLFDPLQNASQSLSQCSQEGELFSRAKWKFLRRCF